MTDAVAVPDGLAGLPPGPPLAATLAGIDPTRVPNNQLLPVLQAQSRQTAHEAARLLGVIAEISRADPTFDDAVDRLDHPFLHAADEIRAALAWSRRAADRETDLADRLVHELPQVYAAFLAGTIDRPKVRVFADHLTGLTPPQIEPICTALVPIAGRLTPGQLTARLRRLIAGIDPSHYERRYRKALRDRFVMAFLDDTGAAVLTARGLTPAQAAAALERIDLLAHAARRAGHPSTLDQIRVDLLAGLLDGTLHHLSRDQIITHLITHRDTDDTPTDDTAGDGTGPRDPAAGRQEAEPDTGPTDAHGNQDPADTDRDQDAGASPVATEPTPAERVAPEPAASAVPLPAGPAAVAPRGPCSAESGSRPDDQRTKIEVRVALSTLLGHDEWPGEIAGLGPIPAAHARDTVNRQHRAEWRYAVTDDHGDLTFDGITRRRPAGIAATGPPGGIVELHLPAALLDRLTAAPDLAGSWAGVLADIAAGYAARTSRDLDAHPTTGYPARAAPPRPDPRPHLHRPRLPPPPPTLRPGPHRRPPARRADDRRRPRPAVPPRPHDEASRRLAARPDRPGRFLWTSPLGGRYPVRPEPIAPPMPAACPRPDDPADDEPAPDSVDVLELWIPEPPPPAPPPAPVPVDLDEPPPF